MGGMNVGEGEQLGCPDEGRLPVEATWLNREPCGPI